MTSSYSCIELCSGAGGLALGFEYAGFHHSLLVDMDSNACATLTRNRPRWNVKCMSVQDAVEQARSVYNHSPTVGPCPGCAVHVLAAGIPCQAFSTAGKRLGFADERGGVWFDVIEAVRVFDPTCILIENVKGLVSHNGGSTLNRICSDLNGEGYHVQWRVLDASKYDVPQKRERLFIVGSRRNVPYVFPTPLNDPPRTLRDALYSPILVEDTGYTYPTRKRAIMSMVPEGGCWVDLPESIRTEYMGSSISSGGGKRGVAKRLAWDTPSPTILTSPCQKQTERCHPYETRPLTVRECARIQTFPDDWTFEGSVASQYRQVGNAVPVELARRVGQSILTHLQE